MKITANTLELALLFSIEKHKGQVRKGDGRPYILHPISVLLTLGRIKKSKNHLLLAIASVLHDTVEDCNVSLQEIADNFGYNVAAIVDELTSDKEEIEKVGKKEYLLNKMLTMSTYALCIKLCDRLDNLSDMDSMPNKFIKRQIVDTKFILDGLKKSKLTATHKEIIKLINKKIKAYS
jgi:(p)ppGpp synthase/HD superfamily hydrolase